VFHFPDGAAAATDVRGGAPGTLGGYEWVHAICLAGGSLLGLEAAAGVTAELLAAQGHELTWTYEEGEPSGQGGAFRAVGDTRIAAFTVVNAVGAIVDRDGNVVRGHLDLETGARAALVPGVEARLASGVPVRRVPGNTTLTVVVTNQRIERRDLVQLGRQVHSSLARAIHPFQTRFDGDVLYAVSTGDVDNEQLDPVTLGVIASELAWDAVLSCFDP